ncbi:MAG: hypothetical protein KatS3mg115_2614 [Candidatus Poribacteria bacterium]|nr:MAG: hypothetical protein KatS3mg115_2614 [Candidatus Poribacteria bacterium]
MELFGLFLACLILLWIAGKLLRIGCRVLCVLMHILLAFGLAYWIWLRFLV